MVAMVSKVRDFISDNRDQINLIMIKMFGTIITCLVIIGYLEAVSKFDQYLNIHSLFVAAIFMIITLAGYFVYVFTMLTDIAGDATLLNYLYMVLAITKQIRALFLFYWLAFETLSPKQDNFYTIMGINGTIFVSILVVWTISSIAFTTLLKKKSPESYMDLSQKNPKVVIIIFGSNLLFTILVFFSGFQLELLQERREHTKQIMFFIGLASFCILLKVNEDEYGIVKKLERSLGKQLEKMFRKVNSVTPEIDEIEVRVKTSAVVVNIVNSSQVHQ